MLFYVVLQLLNLFSFVLFAYVILSWFPLNPNGLLFQFHNYMNSIIEPILQPIRRVVPPIGGIDTSFFVLFIGLMILRSIIGGLV